MDWVLHISHICKKSNCCACTFAKRRGGCGPMCGGSGCGEERCRNTGVRIDSCLFFGLCSPLSDFRNDFQTIPIFSSEPLNQNQLQQFGNSNIANLLLWGRHTVVRVATPSSRLLLLLVLSMLTAHAPTSEFGQHSEAPTAFDRFHFYLFRPFSFS
jgi:hypothetical protein